MTSVVQLAEADDQVGFGHLRELHALAACFQHKGVKAQTYVLGTAGHAAPWAGAKWVADTATLIQLLWDSDAAVSIWSFRRPLNPDLEKLLFRLGKRVWITDQPGEPLPVDI